jgi:hypothetical protein
LRPYEYSTSFLASETNTSLPNVEITTTLSESDQTDYSFLAIVIALIIGAGIIFIIKTRTKRTQKTTI